MSVMYQIIDSMNGDSARGDYAGHIPGVVRPLLRWTSEFSPKSHKISDIPTKETVL